MTEFAVMAASQRSVDFVAPLFAARALPGTKKFEVVISDLRPLPTKKAAKTGSRLTKNSSYSLPLPFSKSDANKSFEPLYFMLSTNETERENYLGWASELENFLRRSGEEEAAQAVARRTGEIYVAENSLSGATIRSLLASILQTLYRAVLPDVSFIKCSEGSSAISGSVTLADGALHVEINSMPSGNFDVAAPRFFQMRTLDRLDITIGKEKLSTRSFRVSNGTVIVELSKEKHFELQNELEISRQNRAVLRWIGLCSNIHLLSYGTSGNIPYYAKIADTESPLAHINATSFLPPQFAVSEKSRKSFEDTFGAYRGSSILEYRSPVLDALKRIYFGEGFDSFLSHEVATKTAFKIRAFNFSRCEIDRKAMAFVQHELKTYSPELIAPREETREQIGSHWSNFVLAVQSLDFLHGVRKLVHPQSPYQRKSEVAKIKEKLQPVVDWLNSEHISWTASSCTETAIQNELKKAAEFAKQAVTLGNDIEHCDKFWRSYTLLERRLTCAAAGYSQVLCCLLNSVLKPDIWLLTAAMSRDQLNQQVCDIIEKRPYATLNGSIQLEREC